jgi:hypothetical protein
MVKCAAATRDASAWGPNTLGKIHGPITPVQGGFWWKWDWEAAHMMHLRDSSSLSYGRPRVGWFNGFRWAFNGCTGTVD